VATPVVPVLLNEKGLFKSSSQADEHLCIRYLESKIICVTIGKNCCCFSQLEMAQVYLQVPLEEESKKYFTLYMHNGLYQFTRLPFGVLSALSIFVRIVESILQEIHGVSVYLDDILVSGKDEKQHRSCVC